MIVAGKLRVYLGRDEARIHVLNNKSPGDGAQHPPPGVVDIHHHEAMNGQGNSRSRCSGSPRERITRYLRENVRDDDRVGQASTSHPPRDALRAQPQITQVSHRQVLERGVRTCMEGRPTRNRGRGSFNLELSDYRRPWTGTSNYAQVVDPNDKTHTGWSHRRYNWRWH